MPALRAAPTARAAQNPSLVVYQGDQGPGRGKHIVFLAGDQEYRSEETLPALARILARRYGFKSSVLFTTDPATGYIDGGSNNIDGLDALKTADLLVIFLRFRDFPDAPEVQALTLDDDAGRRTAERLDVRDRKLHVLQARGLERGVVVGVEVVQADDFCTRLQQPPGQMEPYESGRTGHQYFLHV